MIIAVVSNFNRLTERLQQIKTSPTPNKFNDELMIFQNDAVL